MKKLNYKQIITMMLAALTILFILQNIAVVQIHLLFWTFVISRTVLIFLVLLLVIACCVALRLQLLQNVLWQLDFLILEFPPVVMVPQL